MCGILGIFLSPQRSQKPVQIKKVLDALFTLSETRGKEAAGLAVITQEAISVYKEPLPASQLIKTVTYQDLLSNFSAVSQPLLIFGHSRLVTSGAQERYENNQPVIKEGFVCVHNGIVVNEGELWGNHPDMKKEYEVDTEVIPGLISSWIKKGKDFTESFKIAFSELKGASSIAVFSADSDQLALGTNNGSLYISDLVNLNGFIFASERRILKQLFSRFSTRRILGDACPHQLLPGYGCIADFNNFSWHQIDLTLNLAQERMPQAVRGLNRKIKIFPSHNKPSKTFLNHDNQADTFSLRTMISKEFDRNRRAISSLKRCSKCVLPETFPFISFDEKGICNYCSNHKKLLYEDNHVLEAVLKRYRRKDAAPDCIVAISGGRDSSYGLHYLKKVLGMNPLAYTYDWGMITDLARRNISRMCGALGVEHILISADIGKKRKYIRKNVLAWLKKPDLGTVPLFMAGDKQYFYYANELQRKYGIQLLIMCENRLERTHFKHGFCGVKHRDVHKPAYQLSFMDNVRLVSYYGRQFVRNPSYINASLIDTLAGYISFYLFPHNYIYLFNYIFWDEKEITDALIRTYDWEISSDTDSLWRIGDGTAAFYNYIYYTIAGFSENDTFRSNQIREGLLSRSEALSFLERENQPREASLRWYCDVIGIHMGSAIKIINSTPKLYHS